MAIWTFREREKKKQKSRVFFYVIFYVYTLCYPWITEKELERVIQNKGDELRWKKHMGIS